MRDHDFFALAFGHCLEELARARRKGAEARNCEALLEENLQAAKRKMGAGQARRALEEAAAELRRYSLLDEALLAEAQGKL